MSKEILYDQYSKAEMDDLLNTIVGPNNGLADTLFSHHEFKDYNAIGVAGYIRDFSSSDTINFSDFNASSLGHIKLDDKFSFVYSKEQSNAENSSPIGVLVNLSFAQNRELSFNETDFIAHQIQTGQ
jgi:hypothetical protein